MADASISWCRDDFNCPVCLDLLKDPVTLNCGHSYCMSCITGCWDQDDQKRVYSCPQCRQTFTPRPALGKNTMLAEVVEKLKETKLKPACPAQCYSGSGDVECDVCTGRKYKAIKSCLVCLESYCQTHFERHEEFHSGKRHKLTDATTRLQEMICPQHDKLLEVFCRTDQHCVCCLCMLDEHKNHDTVSAAAERTEKQKQLEKIQGQYQQRVQERQKELDELRKTIESYKVSRAEEQLLAAEELFQTQLGLSSVSEEPVYEKRSAQTAVEDSEKIFTDLIRSIERSRSEVTQLIRDQEKTAVSRAEEQLKKLEQEIEDLKRRDAELEQLSHTDHPIHFLQSFQSLSVPPGSTDSPSITVSSHLSFDDVGKSVSHLRETIEHFWTEEIEKISSKVRYIDIIPTSEPRTREKFLQYFCHLSLDPNTVNKNLCLSERNKVIKYTERDQSYPDHPDRFDHWSQVLCRERVCGRCYWEVEWSGGVGISVSYKSISRKGRGNESGFGCNDQSWSLFCSNFSCSFYHKMNYTELPRVSSSSRIGVYVDHGAGTVSFYSVSDTMTLIHRVHTTFTQPLYPGFEFSLVYKHGSKVKLCKL